MAGSMVDMCRHGESPSIHLPTSLSHCDHVHQAKQLEFSWQLHIPDLLFKNILLFIDENIATFLSSLLLPFNNIR